MKTIMVIGWFGSGFIAASLSTGIEKMGYRVIRVAADPSLRERSGIHDYHVLHEMALGNDEAMLIKMKYRQLSVKTILDKYPETDIVLLIQNTFDWDCHQCDVPVYYYYTEIADPIMPEGFVHGVIGAFVGALETLAKAHPYRVNNARQSFIPYGMDIPMELQICDSPSNYQDRPYFVGFMGGLTFNSRSKDPLTKYIYADRNHVLGEVQKWGKKHKTPIEIRSNESYEKYLDFMRQCKIAINVPGIKGKINQRQYEALACGCVLLQYNYSELNDLGFIDKVNCLIFTDINDLANKLIWAKANPSECDKIATNGQKLFIQTECSWEGRAKKFAQFFEKGKLEPLAEYAAKLVKSNVMSHLSS